MAESVGFEIAKICMEKPLSGVFDRAQFALNINHHIEDLENITKPIIEALLVGVDAGQLNDQARQIALEQLICARYKLLDILDVRKVRAVQKQRMSSSPMKKVLWFLCPSSNPIVCAFRDAPKVKAFIEYLDKVASVHTSLGNSMLRPPPSETVSERQPRSIETGPLSSEEVIGRDEDRDKIIRMLLESSHVQETFSVVSIVGIGGMGKTTLAQYVFNDERVVEHFDLRIWVSVPQVLNVKKVMQSMIAFATDENLPLSEMAQLQYCLHPLIFGKKYLLVLDNIWDNKDLDLNWPELRQQLGFGGFGSMVVATTRSAKVAKTIGDIDPYILNGFASDNSWCLFQRLAFTQGQEPGLEAIGKEIVGKCGNVPLVINSVGLHLRGKGTIRQWEEFHDRLANQSYFEQVPRVLHTLKLTYDELDRGMQLCFSYCSLFPKGYLFEEAELIGLWIALEYVNSESENQCLVDVAKDCILRLREKGLLVLKRSMYRGEIGMHDVIHDLAVSVAGSKYKMAESSGDKFMEGIQHVSFCEKVQLSGNFPFVSLFKLKKHMRSLLVLGNGNPNYHKLTWEGLSKFECLRVLRLESAGLKKVPRTIGKLIHVRYLDLANNRLIKELPNSITQLVNLVYLRLHRCYRLEELPRDLFKLQKLIFLDLKNCGRLRKLPGDVSQVVNLRELCLAGCWQLRHMPQGLKFLSNLHKLDYFVAKGRSSSSIDPNDPSESDGDDVGKLADLNGLSNLEGTLKIVVDGSWTSESEARATNLQGKRNLTKLVLKFKGGSNRENEMMLDGFHPHTNLRELQIDGYAGQRLPKWIDAEAYSFSYLEEIDLSSWKECACIASLGRLPCLKILIISEFMNLEYIQNNIADDPITPSTVPLFPSLERLAFRRLPKLKGWRKCSNSEHLMIGANAFPCLKTITLFEVGIEVLPEEFRGIPSLESLRIYHCENLKEMPEWIDTLTSLKKLYILNCSKLTSLPKQMSNLVSLEGFELTANGDKFTIPRLSNLKTMRLNHMDFEIVPEELRGNTSLIFLRILNWKQLKELPEWIDSLINLEVLYISGCPKLTSLPNQIANLINLKNLKIGTDCQQFKERYQKPSGVDCHLLQHVPLVYFVSEDEYLY